jgi:hypothetical protein
MWHRRLLEPTCKAQPCERLEDFATTALLEWAADWDIQSKRSLPAPP